MHHRQGIPGTGIIRILQGKESGAVPDIGIFLGGNGAHPPGEGRSLPGVVNGKLTPSDGNIILVRNRNRSIHFIIVVFHGDHHTAVQIALHPAEDGFSAVKGDRNTVACSVSGGCFQFHGHHAVQTQHSQGSVAQHHILHAVTGLGKDLLHPSAGNRLDRRGSFLIFCLGHLFPDVFHAVPDLDDGGHDADLVHRRHRVAFFYKITVFHQKLRNLHALGQFYVHGVSGGQGTAAPEAQFQIARLDGALQNTGHRTVCLRFTAGKQGHGCQQRNQCHNGDPGDVLFQLFLLRFLHNRVNLRSAGRRWASSWQPYWQDTNRKSGR